MEFIKKIAILHVYVPNNSNFKYLKQSLVEQKN